MSQREVKNKMIAVNDGWLAGLEDEIARLREQLAEAQSNMRWSKWKQEHDRAEAAEEQLAEARAHATEWAEMSDESCVRAEAAERELGLHKLNDLGQCPMCYSAGYDDAEEAAETKLTEAQRYVSAYEDTNSRVDEAHAYCQDYLMPSAWGLNVWHAVLDNAVVLRELREEERERREAAEAKIAEMRTALELVGLWLDGLEDQNQVYLANTLLKDWAPVVRAVLRTESTGEGKA